MHLGAINSNAIDVCAEVNPLSMGRGLLL